MPSLFCLGYSGLALCGRCNIALAALAALAVLAVLAALAALAASPPTLPSAVLFVIKCLLWKFTIPFSIGNTVDRRSASSPA
jgi:hypothetical protein